MPRFANRTAWRSLVPIDLVPAQFREPVVHLWLGLDAHLVHYPVKSGRFMNIVAVVHDQWNKTGWSAAGDPAELLRHFAQWSWAETARALVSLPDRWLKWALYDRKAPFRGGAGPITLIGDAAHPMLPFLAQGAGMAIEDGLVLARCLEAHDHVPTALIAYESARVQRTARIVRGSAENGRRFHNYTLSDAAEAEHYVDVEWQPQKVEERYDWLFRYDATSVPINAPHLRQRA